MKKKIIVSICLLSFFYCKSQNDSSSFFNVANGLFFSVSAGYSVPVGNFIQYNQSNTNNTNGVANQPGVPKKGQNGKAELMYLLFKNLGFTCAYYTTVNQADTLGQGRFFQPPSNAGQGLGYVGGSGMTSYNFSTSNWQTKNILFGIASQINATKFLKIRLKLSAGYQQVKLPKLNAVSNGYWWQGHYGSPDTVQKGTYMLSYSQSSLTSNNFVFGCGVDIRAILKNGLGIIISLDYLNSVASFSGNFFSTYKDGTSYSYTTTTANSFNKNISLLLFNAGISYDIKSLKIKRKL